MAVPDTRLKQALPCACRAGFQTVGGYLDQRHRTPGRAAGALIPAGAEIEDAVGRSRLVRARMRCMAVRSIWVRHPARPWRVHRRGIGVRVPLPGVFRTDDGRIAGRAHPVAALVTPLPPNTPIETRAAGPLKTVSGPMFRSAQARRSQEDRRQARSLSSRRACRFQHGPARTGAGPGPMPRDRARAAGPNRGSTGAAAICGQRCDQGAGCRAKKASIPCRASSPSQQRHRASMVSAITASSITGPRRRASALAAVTASGAVCR